MFQQEQPRKLIQREKGKSKKSQGSGMHHLATSFDRQNYSDKIRTETIFPAVDSMFRQNNNNHGDDPTALNHVQSSWTDTVDTSVTDTTNESDEGNITRGSSSATSFYESWKSEIASLKNRLDRQLQNMVEHSQHEIDLLSAAVTGQLQIQPSNEYEISSVTDMTKVVPSAKPTNIIPKISSTVSSFLPSMEEHTRTMNRIGTDTDNVSNNKPSIISSFSRQATDVAAALVGNRQTMMFQKPLYDEQESSPRSIQLLRNQQSRWIKQKRRMNQRLLSTPRSQRAQTPTTAPGSPGLRASASNMSVGNRSEKTEPKSNLTKHVTARRIRNCLVPSRSNSSVASGIGGLLASSNQAVGQLHDERSIGASSDISYNSHSRTTSPLPLSHATTPPISYPAPIDEEEDGQMTTDGEDENGSFSVEETQQKPQEQTEIEEYDQQRANREMNFMLQAPYRGDDKIQERRFLAGRINSAEKVLISPQSLDESMPSSPEISESFTPESQAEATMTTRQETAREISILQGTQKHINMNYVRKPERNNVSYKEDDRHKAPETSGKTFVDDHGGHSFSEVFTDSYADENCPYPQPLRATQISSPHRKKIESSEATPQSPSEVSSMLSSPQSSLSDVQQRRHTNQRYFDPVVELRKKSETPVQRSFFSIFDRIDELRYENKDGLPVVLVARGCDAPAPKSESFSCTNVEGETIRPDAPVTDGEKPSDKKSTKLEQTYQSGNLHESNRRVSSTERNKLNEYLRDNKNEGELTIRRNLKGDSGLANDQISISLQRIRLTQVEPVALDHMNATATNFTESLKVRDRAYYPSTKFSLERSSSAPSAEPVLRDAGNILPHNDLESHELTMQKNNAEHSFAIKILPEVFDQNFTIRGMKVRSQNNVVPFKTHAASQHFKISAINESNPIKVPVDSTKNNSSSINDSSGQRKVEDIETTENLMHQQNNVHQGTQTNFSEVRVDRRNSMIINEGVVAEKHPPDADVDKATKHRSATKNKPRGEDHNLQSSQARQVSNYALHDHNGDIGEYTGCEADGVPHGLGTMNYEDGRTYTGEWQVGRWHGHGKSIFPNGDTYTGDYYKDQRHGVGRYEWNDGRVYDGYFERDHRHGRGVYSWPDGSVYTGDFKTGLRHGYGSYTFANGSVYTGNWESGRYHGKGEISWKDGRSYKGDWKNGRANGYGIEMKHGIVRHKGLWLNNKPVYQSANARDEIQRLSKVVGTHNKFENEPKEISNDKRDDNSLRRSIRSKSIPRDSHQSQDFQHGTQTTSKSDGDDEARRRKAQSASKSRQREDHFNENSRAQVRTTSAPAQHRGGNTPLLQKDAELRDLDRARRKSHGNVVTEGGAKRQGRHEGKQRRSKSSRPFSTSKKQDFLLESNNSALMERKEKNVGAATKAERKHSTIIETRGKEKSFKSPSKGLMLARGGPKTSDMLEQSTTMPHSKNGIVCDATNERNSTNRKYIKSEKSGFIVCDSANERNSTYRKSIKSEKKETKGNDISNQYQTTAAVSKTSNVVGNFSLNQLMLKKTAVMSNQNQNRHDYAILSQDHHRSLADKKIIANAASNQYPTTTAVSKPSTVVENVSSNQLTAKNAAIMANQNQYDYVILLHGARVDAATEKLWREFCDSRKDENHDFQNKPVYIVAGDSVGGEETNGVAGNLIEIHDPALDKMSRQNIEKAHESVSAFLKVATPLGLSSDSPITRPSNSAIPSPIRATNLRKAQWNQPTNNLKGSQPSPNVPVVIGTECRALPGKIHYIQHRYQVGSNAECDSGILESTAGTSNLDKVEMSYINRLKNYNTSESIARMKGKLQRYQLNTRSPDNIHVDRRDELVVIRD